MESHWFRDHHCPTTKSITLSDVPGSTRFTLSSGAGHDSGTSAPGGCSTPQGLFIGCDLYALDASLTQI